ncbi:Gfo/Idh/MocA family protein [Skermanella pratensis]|uniref:Gfo/Idh/MocA family protein n=1 Tax=Skermanella pratensis TaxID=2233999 RepID=UPI0013016408|nr:Gfo/Idh/MocA family oxidoreductase [Skermanella pratensis]
MTDRHLGWAVVGCGWVARDYVIPAIHAARNGRVVALCDRDPSGLGSLGTSDLAVVLSDPAVQAVYVATPNDQHMPVVVACAAAGKHVLCEKPMATHSADAEIMVAACGQAGVTLGIAYDQRFHAAHVRLRELVAEGALGTVTQARIFYACWLPPDWSPTDRTSGDRHTDNWRADPRRAGGGALWDLAPHGIDLLEVLLGGSWAELRALVQRRVHDYAVDDGAVLTGRFEDGTLCTIQVAYNCPDAYPRRTLELVGTRAMAVATDTMGQTPGGTLSLIDARTGARSEVPVPGAGRSPFLNQIEAFGDAVLAGRPFPYPSERDLRLFTLMERSCR